MTKFLIRFIFCYKFFQSMSSQNQKRLDSGDTKTSTTKTPIKSATPPKASGPPPPGTAACTICGRYFNEDRLEKHEVICQKSKTKKRKVFDVTKQRVQVCIISRWYIFIKFKIIS